MYIDAIILAAGLGKRMNKGMNKQLILVKEKPILFYTIKAFIDNVDIDHITLVIRDNEKEVIEKEILLPFFYDAYYHEDKISIVNGGHERYHSVYNGLKELKSYVTHVLVHDGARPLIDGKRISEIVLELKGCDAVIIGVKGKDTIKTIDKNGYIKKTIPRESIINVQTPQAFSKALIVEAYEKGMIDPEGITDDAMMVERNTQYPVKVIIGDYTNIKVTTPEDLITMEKYLMS